MAGCDAVIHLASIAGVDTVLKNPVLTMRVSMVGTMNVLEAAQAAGGRQALDRLFHQRGVRSLRLQRDRVGRHDPRGGGRGALDLRGGQAGHRAPGDELLEAVRAAQLCRSAPSTSMGRARWARGPFTISSCAPCKGEPLQIHNDGAQIRAWCYVDDIVDGILMTLTKDEAVGHAFNIGNPRSTLTIHSLAREIMRLSSSGVAHGIRHARSGRRGIAHPQHRKGARAARISARRWIWKRDCCARSIGTDTTWRAARGAMAMATW